LLISLQVLGHICYHILAAGLNGYMATLTNLKNPVNKWKCGAAPISVFFSLFHIFLLISIV
jgi:pyrophosphate--fructose-6-phosphate 1-phosphotransferase